MRRVLLPSVLSTVLLASSTALAGAVRDGFDSHTLAPNDDGSTNLVSLDFDINFFGLTFDGAYVNNNGNITFDASMSTYTPFDLTSTGQQIIAPFFADVDTRYEGEPVRYGAGTVDGRPAWGATYAQVGCYASGLATPYGYNTFQVVLVDRSDILPGDFDIEFNYDTIVWESGMASGSDVTCLGGSSARAGYSNGTGEPGTSLELAGSGVSGAFLDGSTDGTALRYNSLNSDVLGRYIFQARGGEIEPPCDDLDGDGVCDEGGGGAADTDGDGYTDDVDNCPDVPNGDTVGRSKIFVNNDEWTLTDYGYSQAPDAEIFVDNVTSWFTGGESGSFLGWSTNFGVTGSSLASTMAGLGHSWTVDTSVPFTVESLADYDAVFVGGNAVDTDVLIDYVLAGGNVYIMAGTGWGGAAAEADQWNEFLTYFGLEFGTTYNGVGGVRSTATALHEVFDGVDALYSNNGNTIYQTSPANPDTELIDVISDGGGLFAVYDAAFDGDDGQQDLDGDGVGDACDPCPLDADDSCLVVDTDGDGVPDDADDCPTDPSGWELSDWYADFDGDGYGDAFDALSDCSAPLGYVAVPGDCDDDNGSTFPGATEVCDGRDNDCDGSTPEDELDLDGDGWMGCAGDCDDHDALTNPAGFEVCDADDTDEDCDGLVDDGDDSVDAGTYGTFWADWDMDGLGDPAEPAESCDAGEGFVSNADDLCPLDPENDADGDGLCESDDNCPIDANSDQSDIDGDGDGDACDDDIDGDGVPNIDDNCVYDVNPDQADLDGDGEGDICDDDVDGDGVIDAYDSCIDDTVGGVVDDTGCTIDQLCPCDNDWKNHGAYVSCVAHAGEDFVEAGLITEDEKDAIQSEAGASSCGHKVR